MLMNFGDSLDACSVWERGQANLWSELWESVSANLLRKTQTSLISTAPLVSVRQRVSNETGERRSQKSRQLGCCVVLFYVKQTNAGLLEDPSPSRTAWKATLTRSEETTSEKPHVLRLYLHCRELGLRQELMQTTRTSILTDRKMTKI